MARRCHPDHVTGTAFQPVGGVSPEGPLQPAHSPGHLDPPGAQKVGSHLAMRRPSPCSHGRHEPARALGSDFSAHRTVFLVPHSSEFSFLHFTKYSKPTPVFADLYLGHAFQVLLGTHSAASGVGVEALRYATPALCTPASLPVLLWGRQLGVPLHSLPFPRPPLKPTAPGEGARFPPQEHLAKTLRAAGSCGAVQPPPQTPPRAAASGPRCLGPCGFLVLCALPYFTPPVTAKERGLS